MKRLRNQETANRRIDESNDNKIVEEIDRMIKNLHETGWKRIGVCLLCLVLIAAVTPRLSFAKESRLDTKYRVGAYYHDQYNTDLDSLHLEDLDYIVYSFARPYPDGNFRPLENPEGLKKLVDKAHEKGIKAFLSIGGNGSELDFDSIASDENSTIRFIKSIMGMVEDYNLDGIDIDWESPVAYTQSTLNAEALLVRLGKVVKEKGLYYTIAVGGTYKATEATPNTASFTDACLNAFDWLHIMTYSMATVNSPLSFPDVSLAYWHNVRGIDENKLTIGVPFFGTPSWKTYDDLVKESTDNAYRDFVPDPTGQDPLQESHYDGINKVNEKIKMSMARGGGIFSWVINMDSTDPDTSLTVNINKTVKEALKMGIDKFVNKVTIIFKNREIKYSDSVGYPFVDEQNRTLVPFRQTAEAAGFTVSYDPQTQMATAATGNMIITIPIGQNQITVNGEAVNMDTVATIIDDRTYIPMRAFFESAGYQIKEWHDNTKTAYIE